MGDVLQGGLTFEAGRPGGASVWGKVGDFFGGLGRAAASVAPAVLAAAPVALAVGAHLLNKRDSDDAHARRRAIQQQQSARTNAQELDRLLKANNDFLPSTTRRVSPPHMDDIRDTRMSLLKNYERNVANARERRQNTLRGMLEDAAALTRGELPFTPTPEKRINTPPQPVVEHHPEPRPARHASIADALDPAWGKPSKPPATPVQQPIAIPRPPKSPQAVFAQPRPPRPVVEKPAPKPSPETIELAHATVRQRHEAPVDTWQKLKQGGMLSDMEIKQLFHAIDLRYYGAPDEAGRLEAKALEAYAINKLADIFVQSTEKLDSGAVLYQGVEIPPYLISDLIRLDIQNFLKSDRHLTVNEIKAFLLKEDQRPVLSLTAKIIPAEKAGSDSDLTINGRVRPVHTGTARTVMHLPGIRDYTFPQQSDLPISSYPDVTRNQQIYVKHIIAQIENEQKKYGESIAKILAASRFPTNQIWDLKKQPGIPKPGEWAIYKGKLVHDAYLANHVFGEAAAKLGLSKEEALSIANTFSKISRRGMDDQPEDQAAILSGWLDFHTGNPWPKNLKTPKEYEDIKRLKNHFKVRKEKT